MILASSLQGANGVVLIATKRAKRGVSKTDVSLATGIGRLPKRLDLLNTADYLEMRREAFANRQVFASAIQSRNIIYCYAIMVPIKIMVLIILFYKVFLNNWPTSFSLNIVK